MDFEELKQDITDYIQENKEDFYEPWIGDYNLETLVQFTAERFGITQEDDLTKLEELAYMLTEE